MGLVELLLSSKAKNKIIEITSHKPVSKKTYFVICNDDRNKYIVKNNFQLYYLNDFYVTFNEKIPIINFMPTKAFGLYEEIKIEVFAYNKNSKVMTGIVKKMLYEDHRKFKWIFYDEELVYKFLLESNKNHILFFYENSFLMYN